MTRSARPFIVAVVLAASNLLSARAQAPAASVDEPAQRIIGQALGPSPQAEDLRRLTDEIGGRVSGSPAMRRAVAWGLQCFIQAGVDAAHTEKYPLPLYWNEGHSRLDVLTPAPFPVHIVSVGWSPPTPAAGIEASVLDAGYGTEQDFARLGASAEGQILLVHTDLLKTWDNLMSEYDRAPEVIDRAARAGSPALLWMSTRERGLLYRHINTLFALDKLPQAILAREDAERLARFLAAGRTVRVRLVLPNQVSPGPVEEENVVAEIRGSEKPNEVVILGAHLDSWELGTGALDNGAGAAVVVGAARAIHAAGLRPRRTLRFILFSGEEEGEHGSWQYTLAHRAELDNVVAMAVFDSGTGHITGYSLGGRSDTESALREILKPVESWGSNAHTIPPETGSDHVAFMLEGIPVFVADMEEANYIVNYHASSDTYDKVDLRELQLQTAYAAVTVFGIADRPERIGPRLSRSQVEAMMRDTGLDKHLSPELLEMFRRGERGRQP
jgi:Zn-dependent M28 family amino/carboxypeptidase